MALAEGDRERARAGFGEVLALAAGGSLQGGYERSAVWWAVGGSAALAAAECRAARAVCLAAAATGHWRLESGPRARPLARPLRRLFDLWLEPARRQLSEPARAAAEAEGQAMTLEQAVAYALEDAPDAA